MIHKNAFSLRGMLFIVLILGGFWGQGCALGGSPAPDELSIMAWNVQNLFDGVDDGTEYREFDPGEGEWNSRLYQRRLDRTGEVIRGAVSGGPDMVVFSEVENQRVLEDLLNGPLKGQGYLSFAAAPGHGAVRTGVISRFPILKTASRQTGWWRNRSLRPLFLVEVDVEGSRLVVIASHWKSPRDGRSATEPARYQEARSAAEMIRPFLSRDPQVDLILLGDLNTEGIGSPLPAALAPWPPGEGDPPAGLYRAPRQETAGVQGDSLILFDPDPDPLSGPPGTYRWNKAWERPDRALLSSGFLDQEGYRFAECYVPAFEIMENDYGDPWSWNSEQEEGYSDHLPLLLTFQRMPGSGEGG